MIDTRIIPLELRSLSQWVAWRFEIRHGNKTKVPLNPLTLQRAMSDQPRTWGTFRDAMKATQRRGIAGIGFVFSDKDPFCGIDLDGCISEHGEIHPQAMKVVEAFNSYTEVSPSGRGLKIFIRGKKPQHPDIGCCIQNMLGCSRIEVYDQLRFFTVTTLHLGGTPLRIADCQPRLLRMCSKFWPKRARPTFKVRSIADAEKERRCLDYVSRRCSPAISGQGGHNATLRVACEGYRFGLQHEAVLRILDWFNESKCHPKWTQRELAHKASDAHRKVAAKGEIGIRIAFTRHRPRLATPAHDRGPRARRVA